MHEHFHDVLARGAMLLETVSMLREFVAFRSLLKNADVESRKTTWRTFVLHVISLLFFFFVLHAIYYPPPPFRLGIVSESSESLIFPTFLCSCLPPPSRAGSVDSGFVQCALKV
jgi:hypothetical protein